MKTKTQKSEELENAKSLLSESDAVLFLDFAKVKTADLRFLRVALARAGSKLLVIKKRLLGILLKQENLHWNDREHKTQVGAVFAKNIEEASAAVYRFLKGLEKEKKIEGLSAGARILGGFDLLKKLAMDAKTVSAIGSLPPREVLLAQLAAMIASPVKSLLYVLDQKATRSTGSGSSSA